MPPDTQQCGAASGRPPSRTARVGLEPAEHGERRRAQTPEQTDTQHCQPAWDAPNVTTVSESWERHASPGMADADPSPQDTVRVVLPGHPPLLTPAAADALLAFLLRERQARNPAGG